ncbi:biotin-dependent carboxyltransferase family protein [Parasphingorhabdus sp. JC815]|uniref:5-oxoprolinase subunit C family protein n=1 Tax=Parasphingorhabdus sp. JC815 TaxID=3232140 RepID=UPI003458599D
MTLTVVKPGLQTTLQGAPFSGHRHLGMPAAGAADCLSLLLANHLVGNAPDTIAIEITLDDAKFTFTDAAVIALTGSAKFLRLNGQDRSLHKVLSVQSGDEIHVGPAKHGCRSYLAIAGEIVAQSLLGGQSTYLSARLGGYHGRALKAGDILGWQPSKLLSKNTSCQRTPNNLQLAMTDNYILRVTIGPEFSMLSPLAQTRVFEEKFMVGSRANRMGIGLQGAGLSTQSGSQINSSPVFTGTVQCPPDGQAFLLGPDAQTTGGYPRIAQVIRADRHLIGQIRPGSQIQFVRTTNERAVEIYRQKLSVLKPWLGPINLW